MSARTIPARGSIAALLVLADRALVAHQRAHGFYAPDQRTTEQVERAALHSRRDALADAFRCVVADDLGVQFMLLGMDDLVTHAHATMTAVDAL